jgi:hypothetical protein
MNESMDAGAVDYDADFIVNEANVRQFFVTVGVADVNPGDAERRGKYIERAFSTLLSDPESLLPVLNVLRESSTDGFVLGAADEFLKRNVPNLYPLLATESQRTFRANVLTLLRTDPVYETIPGLCQMAGTMAACDGCQWPEVFEMIWEFGNEDNAGRRMISARLILTVRTTGSWSLRCYHFCWCSVGVFHGRTSNTRTSASHDRSPRQVDC